MNTKIIIKVIFILFILTENCLSEVNKDIIERVKKFFAAVPQPSTEYSAQDLERVQTDSEWLENFAVGARSAAQVVKRLALHLTFRNIYGITYLTEYSFPQEIYKIGFITPIGKDRKGRHILLIRVNRWRKSAELYETLKKFITYQFEKIDIMKPYPDVLVIYDYSGLEQANVDKELLDFTSTIGVNYVRPKGEVLGVNAPPFLSSLLGLLSTGTPIIL